MQSSIGNKAPAACFVRHKRRALSQDHTTKQGGLPEQSAKLGIGSGCTRAQLELCMSDSIPIPWLHVQWSESRCLLQPHQSSLRIPARCKPGYWSCSCSATAAGWPGSLTQAFRTVVDTAWWTLVLILIKAPLLHITQDGIIKAGSRPVTEVRADHLAGTCADTPSAADKSLYLACDKKLL